MGFQSLVIIFLLCISMANSDHLKQNKTILQCLTDHSIASPSISSVTFFPTDPSFTSTLQSYTRNLRFTSTTTPKPLFIVVPSHVSHIQASIICCKTHGLEMRIRSGGHDYDGLSYVSKAPFMILDLFNLRSVIVDNGTAWVESVGVGGHFSGGGYGNMMRKFGLSVDNVIDAKLVDVNGNVLDRESMGEDLFWAIKGGGGASFGIIISWKIKNILGCVA
ncbi:hypothetical protein E1A91_D10G006800v1 [Gossypium mustelinum]|uniref:FAD linked oxidase N-terminal domain-containing protein n=1 Tax=Gossypium mustelinum TaxID=34275 RepID=A0A5D2T1M1_GOSMU|nr:hypothetical protein E1A91_D10G006800v1 [Gossypium mustelinum]